MFSSGCCICCKCMFHLFQTYVANVLFGYCICCKRMFQLFQHVSICCSTCGQCPNGRALPSQSACAHAKRQSGPAPNRHRIWCPCTIRYDPPWWSIRSGQHMGIRAVLPPSLAFGLFRMGTSLVLRHARCALSLALGYARCAPSLALRYVRCTPSLMHVAGLAHAHALPGRCSRRRRGA
jgi:hypothetical protein